MNEPFVLNKRYYIQMNFVNNDAQQDYFGKLIAFLSQSETDETKDSIIIKEIDKPNLLNYLKLIYVIITDYTFFRKIN
jgi:hypothetical protein